MVRTSERSSKTTGSTTASRMALNTWQTLRRTRTLKSVSSQLARVRSTNRRTFRTKSSRQRKSKSTAKRMTSRKATQRSQPPESEETPNQPSRMSVPRFRIDCMLLRPAITGPEAAFRYGKSNPISPSKLGVKIPLPTEPRISSRLQKRPPSSSSLGHTVPS